MKKRILFVCLGNICRSPAAEGIMRTIVGREGCEGGFEIDSAGTYGGHAGELPDPRMRAAAKERGIDLVHRSRRFTADDFDRFDMILTMDDNNYETVHRMARSPEDRHKIYRMTQFCRHFEADHIPDPYYEGRRGFEHVLDLLDDACEGLLDHVRCNPGK